MGKIIFEVLNVVGLQTTDLYKKLYFQQKIMDSPP